MKNKWLLLMAAVGWAVFPPVLGGMEEFNIQLCSQYGNLPVSDVRCEGNYVYCTDYYNGFFAQTADETPHTIRQWEEGGGHEAHDYCVVDGDVYFCSGSLQLLHNSMRDLYKFGDYSGYDGYNSLHRSGTRLYLSAGDKGVYVFDISAPPAVILKGRFQNGSLMRKMTSSGNFLYVHIINKSGSLDTYSLIVLDVSDPSAIKVAGGMPLPGEVRDMTVEGGRMAVAAFNPYLINPGEFNIGTIQIYNLTNPSRPAFVGQYARPHTVYSSVLFSGNTLLACENSEGIGVYDISGGNPVHKGLYATPNEPAHYYKLAKNDRYIFAAKGAAGLEVLQLQSPHELKFIAHEQNSWKLSAFDVYGVYAHLIYEQRDNVRILNVADPFKPVVVGAIGVTGPASVRVNGKYACVSRHTNDVLVYSAANPTAPVLAGSVGLSARPGRMEFYKENMLLAVSLRRLHVIDLNYGNLGKPKLLGSVDVTEDITGLAVMGDRVFASGKKRLTCVSLSVPSRPKIVGVMDYRAFPDDFSIINSIVSDGKYLYLTDNWYRFTIYDPARFPTLLRVGYLRLTDTNSTCYGVDVGSGNAYIRGGIEVLEADIKNPAFPLFKGKKRFWRDSYEVKGSGEVMYVGGSVFSIFRNTSPANRPPQILLSRYELNYRVSKGESWTIPQEVFLSNGGSGTLNWTARPWPFVDWLSVVPASGTNGGRLEIKARHPDGRLDPSKDIIVEAPGALNSPCRITLRFTIGNPEELKAPFGEFATPAGGVVSGSVPFTGWALDDQGVMSVSIYRKEGSELFFVGAANFVAGARPDVEEAFPGYPLNYRAGWGYMMLTNMLPRGDGLYEFHAVAVDWEGKKTTLGVKRVRVNNKDAVLPFGAIDTPAQGGTASGSAFVNFGWALTPLPKTIPRDGSTIRVWVDGVMMGHPVYNNFRADVAELFPTYNNSRGASGHFYLDAAKLSSGLHTIAWSVKDDAGKEDGVGSRYFTVNNPGTNGESGVISALTTETSVLGEGVSPAEYADAVWDDGPAAIRTGFGVGDGGRDVFPGADGALRVEIGELERVEAMLAPMGTAGEGMVWRGGLRVKGKIRALPAGACLDAQNGVFYWQPGPGFIGEYRFVFIQGARRPGGPTFKKYLNVRIVPRF